MTFFYKRILPFVWFGLLAVFLVSTLMSAWGSDGPPMVPFLLGPVVMSVMGVLIFKKMFWPLADDVSDLGDRLRIRHGGREFDVMLSDIVNVDRSLFMNPPRVTLTRRSNREQIAFVPAGGLSMLRASSNPAIDALIVRIDAARAAAARR